MFHPILVSSLSRHIFITSIGSPTFTQHDEVWIEGACSLVSFFDRSRIMVSHHIEAEAIHFVGIN
ncbi:Uncharacterised protein [Mycobacterium tuberculosis]|nr:Uncharacterised protein [Mycobacterium tuberculosis]